jgi:hypothetical protein
MDSPANVSLAPAIRMRSEARVHPSGRTGALRKARVPCKRKSYWSHAGGAIPQYPQIARSEPPVRPQLNIADAAQRYTIGPADVPPPEPRRRRPVSRLVVISNRLPVVVDQDDSGIHVRPASGGLVTALTPILRRVGGLWIGWAGAPNSELRTPDRKVGRIRVGRGLRPRIGAYVQERKLRGFTRASRNEIIWPLVPRPSVILQLCAGVLDAIYEREAEIRRRGDREGDEPDDFPMGSRLPVDGAGASLARVRTVKPTGFLPAHTLPPPGYLLQAALAAGRCSKRCSTTT